MHRNTMVLDLRQRVHFQNQIIRDLKSERDQLTQELGSRLYFVEAQLLKEQKQIEAMLKEKDTYIRFQNLQIESLKCILQQVDNEYQNHSRPSSKRSKSIGPHNKYSAAVDEYMKQDACVVSRALPVIIQSPTDTKCSKNIYRTTRQRMRAARSLPELNNAETTSPCCEDCDVRRWNQTSDLDSEHSDSIDSGISSPCMNPRNLMHMNQDEKRDQQYQREDKMRYHSQDEDAKSGNQEKGLYHIQEDNNNVIYLQKEHVKSVEDVRVKASPRRSSSIGSFFNRKFSSSPAETDSSAARRHSSFTEIEMAQNGGHVGKAAGTRPFISSANRTFGTNHRSVTKPRDIKFRKLFKFRRREQSDTVQRNDFISV